MYDLKVKLNNKILKIVLWILSFVLGAGIMYLVWVNVISPLVYKETPVGELVSTSIDSSQYESFFPEQPVIYFGGEPTDEEANFYFFYFQPIIREYVVEDDISYMIVEYEDPASPGIRRNTQVLLTGDFEVPSLIVNNEEYAKAFKDRYVTGTVYLDQESRDYISDEFGHIKIFQTLYDENDILTVEELKKKLPVGTQISILFMGRYLVEELLVDEYCSGYEFFCGLAQFEWESELSYDMYNFGQGGQSIEDFYIIPYLITPVLIHE